MAAITSLLVCGLGAVGREVTLLVSFVVAMVLGVNPPFLNGLAVFAHKHALALAHASEGGKCRVWEKWPTGQPQAGGSEYLELHGAFSITLRAPGAELLSRLGFLAWCGAQNNVTFGVLYPAGVTLGLD